jgi:EAL domain-containing protein (putative c-di-GMP-specific phosphodiesterase class I)
MTRDAFEKMVLTNSLRKALENGELCLHFQPLICMSGKSVVGFEALLRWNSPQHGSVAPCCFIPLAEQSGIILSIGEWVIGEACRFARTLAEMGRSEVYVAVNVSPRQLAAENFVATVRQCIKQAGVKPGQIEIEITENVFIESLEKSTRKLVELSSFGVRLSLDDFGTGFSSLTYLRNLPVRTLKIDKSFIDRIEEDRVQEGFIRSIIDMAHVLSLNVVAEGVETELQLAKLAEFGCDYVQGYIFSRPVSREEALGYRT